MKKVKNDAYYDEVSEGYDELYEDEQLTKLCLISGKMKVYLESSLLDVGCGTGISTRFFECYRTGIDPSAVMIEKAKAKDAEGTYVVGCAEELPFPEDSFDFVISVTAVHNFSDIERGLSEIRRAAKKGKENIVLSILKKSKKFPSIDKAIKKLFHVKKITLAEKDIIFFVEK